MNNMVGFVNNKVLSYLVSICHFSFQFPYVCKFMNKLLDITIKVQEH